MSTQWRKILGDFRQHRLQILAILTVLAVGTTGVIAAVNAYAVLRREIASSYRRANSPDVALWFDRVDPRALALVRAQPGVSDADARRVVTTKVRGRKPGEWLPMRLIVREDFTEQRVGTVHLHGDADWPAPDAGLYVEQSSLSLLPGGVGGAAVVRLPGGAEASVPVVLSVHDTAVAPGFMDLIVYAYATPAVAAQLGQNGEADQIVVVAEDRAAAAALGARLSAALAAAGLPALRSEVLPNQHPHAGLMNALLSLLRGFAALAFVCSAALALFVVSLWMKRETRQVGIMKTIGARTHQLAFQYLALVCPLVLVATGIAFAAGSALGRWLILDTGREQNLDIRRLDLPPGLLGLELLCTIGIPVLAMAVPIVRAARLSAREAIADAGITAPRAGVRLLGRLRLPGDRRTAFATRNTFRRPWRFAITVLGLALGALILQTSVNHYRSLMGTIDAAMADRGHDIQVFVSRPLPPEQLVAVAQDIPGVAIAEAWRRASVEIVRSAAGGPATSLEGEGGAAGADANVRVQIVSYPVDTRLPRLTMKQGRWPAAGEDAVVATRALLQRAPGLKVGDDIVLRFRQNEVRVRLAGLVDEISTAVLYGDAALHERLTGATGRAVELRIRATTHDRIDGIVVALDQALLDARIASTPIFTRFSTREAYDEHFRDFVKVASVVALSAALVGAICLVAFACLNVVERVREIGVIRTLGASQAEVVRLFLAESGLIVLLGVGLGLAASFPATVRFNEFTSTMALLVPVPLVFSWGAFATIVAGMPLVLGAVWFFVRRFVNVPVRETLAYE